MPNQRGMSLIPAVTSSSAKAKKANNLGRYQRGWSKVRMKVTKYRPRVEIHNRGSGATSWLI
jgi:hypothetical protein